MSGALSASEWSDVQFRHWHEANRLSRTERKETLRGRMSWSTPRAGVQCAWRCKTICIGTALWQQSVGAIACERQYTIVSGSAVKQRLHELLQLDAQASVLPSSMSRRVSLTTIGTVEHGTRSWRRERP